MEGSMERRCDEREKRKKRDTIGPEGAESLSPIINDRVLLGHDAERHDPNTTMMASKMAGKPDLIYFNNIVESHVKITSIINEIIFYTIYKREGVMPSGLTLLLMTTMSLGSHFGQPMPIATHWPIG